MSSKPANLEPSVQAGESDGSLEETLPQIYDELRHLAAGYLRQERPDHTLQPTALVHEAYLKLLGQHSVDWQNRAQVLGLAARAMRRILMTHASARAAGRRGGGARKMELDTALDLFEARGVPMQTLDVVLRELEAIDSRQSQIVELRFFGGLTIEETAKVMELTQWAEAQAASPFGRRVGAYVLVRELGRGGMGAVWLAHRADGRFEQQVAIKILKRGTDTEAVLRRFHAERQILARLEHPNIARLIDGGETADGLPFLVMENVTDGVPVTDYARARRLSIPDRLRLFRKICAAVQFAHQNLVIHRDLKPANILVTAEGEPKLSTSGLRAFSTKKMRRNSRSRKAARASAPRRPARSNCAARPLQH